MTDEPDADRPQKDTFTRFRRILSLRRRAWRIGLVRFFDRFIPNESQRVFALTLIVGAACGVTAVAFHLSIIWLEDLLVATSLASPHFVFWGIATPFIGALICGVLLSYVVPGARGSGIPQIKVAYAVKGGFVQFAEVVGKFAVGVIQLGSGSSLGREGPTVHICAGLASQLGRLFALSRKNIKRMIPVGAAAGIAAAFNAPIAAVTFTIEEIVGDLDQTILSGVIVAAAIAAAIERGILGEHPVFTVSQTYGLHHLSSLILYAALGLMGGFASLAFTESLLKLRGIFQRTKLIPNWAKPSVGGLVTGILAVSALYFLGVEGITGGGYTTLSVALTGSLTFKVMAVLCVLKLGATVFSYGSGGAGGIFAPALFIGGMLGGAIGLLDVNVFGHESSAVGAFALVGMGAAFAGIVRAPITSVLIIFEMTGSYALILPLMLSNMIAYAVAKHFRPLAVYDALLEQDNIHLPHPSKNLGRILEDTRVIDAFRPEAITLEPQFTVAEAFEFVHKHEFTTFPVVNESGRCVGMITEMRLRRTLAEKRGEALVSEIADRCHTIRVDQPLSKAVVRMNAAQVRMLSVIGTDGERTFLGVLTMSDIVRAQAAAIDTPDMTITPER